MDQSFFTAKATKVKTDLWVSHQFHCGKIEMIMQMVMKNMQLNICINTNRWKTCRKKK